jgi:hypothetical protein
MKAIFTAIIALSILYAVDQEFADGQYTVAAKAALGQVAHSLGF